MTIELDDKSYIVCIWFSSHPVSLNNWLACVVRDPDNSKKYKGWSRFHYVKDDKIFFGDDEKSWTIFHSQESQNEEDMIKFMDMSQLVIREGYPEMDKINVKGSLKDLIPLPKGKYWMHMKEVKE